MTEGIAQKLQAYLPAQPEPYYYALFVSSDGKISHRAPLSEKQVSFLKSVAADASVWDGTQGTRGIRYNTDQIPKDLALQTPSLSRSEASKIRNIYKSLKQNTVTYKSVGNLQNELNAKLLISNAVISDSPETAESLLEKAREHVCQMRRARDAKHWFTFARAVLLTRVFSHDPAGALLFGPVSEYQFPCRKQAAQLHSNLCASTMLVFEASRAFIDAYEAVHTLFALEKTLQTAFDDICRKAKPDMRALQNQMVDITEKGFVNAAMQGVSGVLNIWKNVEVELQHAQKMKDGVLYSILSRAYKDIGDIHDHVQKWKDDLKVTICEAVVKKDEYFKKLLDCWETFLES